MATVLCVGISVQDWLLSVDKLPEGDGKTYAGHRKMVIGGIGASAALAVARLGGRPSLVSRVGNDETGEAVMSVLTNAGVDTSRVDWLNGVSTAMSAIVIDAEGNRMLINHSDPMLFRGRPRLENCKFDALMTDTCWPCATIASLRLARERGVPGVVDFDRRPDEPTSHGIFELASHIVFGEQGLRSLTGIGDIETALSSLRDKTEAWLAVTCGERGVLYFASGEIRRFPSFRIEAVDTLGAGDVFHGAMALELARGAGEIDAMAFASAAAAIKCTRFGGGGASPMRDEVEAFLARTKIPEH